MAKPLPLLIIESYPDGAFSKTAAAAAADDRSMEYGLPMEPSE